MTEGPEATYLYQTLLRPLKGRRLTGITIRSGRYRTHGPPAGFKDFRRSLPSTLDGITKKGKLLVMTFANGWNLINRLGMTGWWWTRTHDAPYTAEDHVVLHFEKGHDLVFSDMRNFGTLLFTQDAKAVTQTLSNIAPDILSHRPDPVAFLDRLRQSPDRTIDVALMDQQLLVSGVGNIIKSEGLYAAGLDPRRRLSTLTRHEALRLYDALRQFSVRVLRQLRDYGIFTDEYVSLRAVYQREVDPVGRPVKHYTSADGRSTFWVPTVQK